MSPLLWLKKIFVPEDQQEDQQDVNDLRGLEEDSSFLFSQHMRVLLAILVAFISALCIWWIMA